MIKHTTKPVALALAAALTIPYAATIAAETTPTGDERVLEEVFVVGKRRAYQGNFDNLEQPSADQIIAEDLLREVGAINLNEALDLSASVARQNNFGGLWNAFSVRGFAGDINLPSGFLVNGFNAGRGFAGPRDLAGIESVEVLKGPRSALFGRGEPGGTVNLVTKRPQFERTGDLPRHLRALGSNALRSGCPIHRRNQRRGGTAHGGILRGCGELQGHGRDRAYRPVSVDHLGCLRYNERDLRVGVYRAGDSFRSRCCLLG